MKASLFDAAVLALGLVAAGFLGWMVGVREPPVAVGQAAVIRMLDVTMRDSNTTNRRQRFVCTPAEER